MLERISEKVTMVIFEGGEYSAEIEKIVSRARKAVVLDLIELAGEVREIDEIILVTNHPELVESAQKLGAQVDLDDTSTPFNFGNRLREVINRYDIHNVLYFGGAAAPLISREDLTRMALALKEQKNTVIANSFDSADFVAFTPGSAINNIELPSIDNPLAQKLHKEAGLRMGVIENCLSTTFDVDTLIDVMILGVQPRAGTRAKRVIRNLNFDLSPLEKAKKVLIDPGAEVLVYGRVNPDTVAYLNSNAKCRLRIFMEERGMRASGRLERNEIRSVLGFILEKNTPREFFEYLESLCQCAFLDTRVLFAHLKKNVSKSDRFNSDLGYYQNIEDAFVKEFTFQAVQSKIPVICGGHALVNGGIWALLDAANLEKLGRINEDKIHRIVVELGAPICGLTIDMITNYLGVNVKVIAITDAFSTRIDPPLNQEIHAGQVLYVLGADKQINSFMEYVSPNRVID
ncbi:MAG: hypothetical protein QHH02_01425 [Syntrophomonadaceae bacterium]|nr:hypothetical protein [Syntrophomonadaceae bacterium]